MPVIAPTLKAIVAKLDEQGLRGTLRPDKLNTPCVWVAFESADVVTLAGDLDVTAVLHLLVGSIDHERAYEKLDDLLVDVMEHFDLADDRQIEAVEFGPQGWPCYRYPITVRNT